MSESAAGSGSRRDRQLRHLFDANPADARGIAYGQRGRIGVMLGDVERRRHGKSSASVVGMEARPYNTIASET